MKKYGNVLPLVSFLDVTSSCFRLLFHAWNLLYATSPQNRVPPVGLVLKDNDTDAENLSSLIRHSVSDGQKTRVPTGSGNHGKSGEKKVPCMEKSWNLKKPE